MAKDKQLKEIISLNINGGVYKYNKDELDKRVNEYKKLIEVNLNTCIDIYLEKHLKLFKNKIKKNDLQELFGYNSRTKFYEDLKNGSITTDMILKAFFIFNINPCYLLLGNKITSDYGCFVSEDNHKFLTEKNQKKSALKTIEKIYDLQKSETLLVKEFIESIINSPDRKPLKTNLADFYRLHSKLNQPLKEEKNNVSIKEKLVDEIQKAYLHRHKPDLIKLDKILNKEQTKRKRVKADCYIDEQGVVKKAKTHEPMGYFEPLPVDEKYLEQHKEFITALKKFLLTNGHSSHCH